MEVYFRKFSIIKIVFVLPFFANFGLLRYEDMPVINTQHNKQTQSNVFNIQFLVQNGLHTDFWDGDSATLIGTRGGSDSIAVCGEVHPDDFVTSGERFKHRSCFIECTGINNEEV